MTRREMWVLTGPDGRVLQDDTKMGFSGIPFFASRQDANIARDWIVGRMARIDSGGVPLFTPKKVVMEDAQ